MISTNKEDNIDIILTNKNFDSYLKKLFEKTIENIQCISNIKTSLLTDISDNSGLILDKSNDYIEVPSFNEYYKNNEIEDFRSKLMSKTFSDKK